MNFKNKILSSTQISNPKFLVGVMHVTQDPWLSITINGQLPTWKSTKYKNYSVIYFFGLSNWLTSRIDFLIEKYRWTKGRYASYLLAYSLMFTLKPWINFLPDADLANESISKIKAQALKVNIPELTSTMRWKKLSFLNYFLNNSDADFLIITTTSSVINFNPIVDFLSKVDDKNIPLYAGRVHIGYDCEFSSGSFTLMNREAASILLSNRKLIPVHVMDDIGFGTAFKSLGIHPINLASIDLDSLEKLKLLPKESLLKVGHFRFKSGTSKSRNDVMIMRELMSILHDLQ